MPSREIYPSIFLTFLFNLSLYLYLLAHIATLKPKSPQNPLITSNSTNTETRVMATLQRSAKSFRRQGSSGMVWDDSLLDAFHQGAKNDRSDLKELRPCQSAKAMFTGVDFSFGPNNSATPPGTCPRSLSSFGTNPSQRAYTRSLSGIFSRQQHLGRKVKMGKTADP